MTVSSGSTTDTLNDSYDAYGNILSVEYVEDYTDEVMSSNTYSYTNMQWAD